MAFLPFLLFLRDNKNTISGTKLIAAEEVAGVDLGLYVVEDGIVAVGDDGVGLVFKGSEVVHDLAAEERGPILQRRLIDNHLGALGLDALHNALDGALAEVVGI